MTRDYAEMARGLGISEPEARMIDLVAETLAKEPDQEQARDLLWERFSTDAELYAVFRQCPVTDWAIRGMVQWYLDGLGDALQAPGKRDANDGT
jgi:hypothetical protein